MTMTPQRKKLLFLAIGFGSIIDYIILDQISKWLILEHVFRPILQEPSLGFFEWITSPYQLPSVSTDIFSFFNLTMVWNHGVSFGFFQSGNPWPLIILAGLISIIFMVWLARATSWVEVIALPMVIGGALGNIIDRLHFRAVADFLDFHIMGWHYPAFNLADSFITIGIVIIVVNSLFFDGKNKKADSV